MQLRGYQQALERDILGAWDAGAADVLGVLPTGGGKTPTFSSVIKQWGPHLAARYGRPPGTVTVAHRSELVSQMSLTLARNGVRHRVIGPDALRKTCVGLHIAEVGRSFYDPGSVNAAAGVDSLVNLADNDPFLQSVGLYTCDEAHHTLRANKWGKARGMFARALGLGVTATPCRADRKGLGRQASGVFDVMVQGPTLRELINLGYLTDYRIFCPKSDLDLSKVDVGASGEFVQVQLSAARKRSTLTGDVVESYLHHAPGKLGITFEVDIESATETAAAYRARGVPAEVVSSKTPADLRRSILARFKAREVLQLVNVDLFGEGFDLPAVEVVSMARPTASYSLYAQQFGRMLRLMIEGTTPVQWEAMCVSSRLAAILGSRKPKGMLIDHVGNVARHKLPDRWREWSLDDGEKRGKLTPSDAVPMWECPVCTFCNERIFKACQNPEGCGGELLPPLRSGPEFVDGDLFELDPAILAQLRGEVARIDGPSPVIPGNHAATVGAHRSHQARAAAQAPLRHVIATWAGYWRQAGHDDPMIYRRFFHRFGVDVMTAQTLGAREADALRAILETDLQTKGVAV